MRSNEGTPSLRQILGGYRRFTSGELRSRNETCSGRVLRCVKSPNRQPRDTFFEQLGETE